MSAASFAVLTIDMCLYFLQNNFPEEAADGCPDDPDHCRAECKEGGCVAMRITYCREALKRLGASPSETERSTK